MNVILPCLRGNGKFWLKFEFVGEVGLEKRSENIRIQWNENRIPEKVEWESGDFGMAVVKLKTGNPALRLTMELSARNASFHCESRF